jgi:N-acetylneuraminic acid mutarotase
VEKFDIEEETWIKCGPMNCARAQFSAQVINGTIYVIGGFKAAKESLVDIVVELYDSKKDMWFKVEVSSAFPARSA